MSKGDKQTHSMMNSHHRVFEYPLIIRESHLDFFGHVNNATYLQIFEEARWELVTKGGYGMDTLNRVQAGPVVLEVDLKFIKELGLREEVVIKTQLQQYEGKVGTLHQWIDNHSGETCATAKFKFGLLDFKTRKLILPNPEWSRAIDLG